MVSKVLKTYSLPPANETIPELDGLKSWKPQFASLRVLHLGEGKGVALTVQAYGGQVTDFVLTNETRDHLVRLLLGQAATVQPVGGAHAA